MTSAFKICSFTTTPDSSLPPVDVVDVAVVPALVSVLDDGGGSDVANGRTEQPHGNPQLSFADAVQTECDDIHSALVSPSTGKIRKLNSIRLSLCF
jgi:hypothetical protein